jgi:hypothetical protein
MHAHTFEDNAGWEGERVLVVGIGNSAVDIAVEASWVAARTVLSARTPAHVLPKYVFGRPLDTLQTGRLARLPWRLRQAMTEAMLRVSVGRYETYGLPRPTHGVFQAHPTISDTILSRLAHGEITAKAAPDRFEGSTVVFADGSREDFDVVVYATGYRITFPFLDQQVIDAPDNRIELYQRIWPLDVPGLAFVGLVQPLGAIMPIAELQGKVLADWLRGRYRLPGRAAMASAVAGESRAVRRRYIGSRRHTLEVDFDEYMHRLRRELARGARRAAGLAA